MYFSTMEESSSIKQVPLIFVMLKNGMLSTSLCKICVLIYIYVQSLMNVRQDYQDAVINVKIFWDHLDVSVQMAWNLLMTRKTVEV